MGADAPRVDHSLILAWFLGLSRGEWQCGYVRLDEGIRTTSSYMYSDGLSEFEMRIVDYRIVGGMNGH